MKFNNFISFSIMILLIIIILISTIRSNIKYNLSIDNKVNEKFTNIPQYVRYVNLTGNPGSWNWRGVNNNSLMYNNLETGYYKLKIYYRNKDIKLGWVKINGNASFKNYNTNAYNLSNIKLQCSNIKETLNPVENFEDDGETEEVLVNCELNELNISQCNDCGEFIYQTVDTQTSTSGCIAPPLGHRMYHLCRPGDGSCSEEDIEQEIQESCEFNHDELENFRSSCTCGESITQSGVDSVCNNPQTLVCSNGMGSCTYEFDTSQLMSHYSDDCVLIQHNKNNCKSDCSNILPTIIRPAGPEGSCSQFNNLITTCNPGDGACVLEDCVYGSNYSGWGSCVIPSPNELCGEKTQIIVGGSGCPNITQTQICINDNGSNGFTYTEDENYETPPGLGEPFINENKKIISVNSNEHNLYANLDNNRYIEVEFYVNNTNNISFEMYTNDETSIWIIVQSISEPS